MSEGINQVMLLGNIGSDVELKQGPKGPWFAVNLATTRSFQEKDKAERTERTHWHHCKMFGKRAEGLAKYLKKGTRLLVQGRLEDSSYEKDGQKKYSYEVIIEELYFTQNNGQGRENAPRLPAAAMTNGTPFGGREMPALTDLPF